MVVRSRLTALSTLTLPTAVLAGFLAGCSDDERGQGFANLADPDGDGLPTSLEDVLGSDPRDPDSPFVGGDLDVVDEDGPAGDGITDGLENYLLSIGIAAPVTASDDLDGDDVPDYLEIRSGTAVDNSEDPFPFGASDILNDFGPPGDGIADGLERFLVKFGARRPVTITSDTDGDGLSDVLEVRTGSNPFDSSDPAVGQFLDVDGDGLPDYFELLQAYDPYDGDQPVVNGGDDADGGVNGPDGDGVSDAVEFALIDLGAVGPITARTDSDADGLPDVLEIASGSDVFDSDSPIASGGGDTDGGTGPSGDGISDALEFYLTSNGASSPVTASTDTDGDALTDVLEARSGSDPFDAASPDPFRQADVDADGIADVREVAAGSDPLDGDDPIVGGADDDDDATGPGGDRLTDGLEGQLIALGATAPVTARSDRDGDGVPDWIENLRFSDLTDPNSPQVGGGGDAADAGGPAGDGISDALEQVLIALGATAPITTATDSDGDGIGDALELRVGTNPFDGVDPVPNQQLDLDGDGAPDYLELVLGSDPLDANDPATGGAGDSDLDRVTDGLEAVLAALGADQPVGPATDTDGDGLADVLEVALGSDFLDAERPVAGGADTDDATGPAGDGLSDAYEFYVIASGGFAPITRRTDLDGDGAPGYLESEVGGLVGDANSPVVSGGSDSDADNVTDALEQVLVDLGASAPVDALTDSDADGAPDYLEARAGGLPFDATDPADNGGADSDGDGLSDGLESTLAFLGADLPVNARSDSDFDSTPDYYEVGIGGDPFDSSDPVVSGEVDTNDTTGPPGDTIADGLEQVLIDAGATAPVGLATDTDADGAPDYLEIITFDDFLDGNAPVVGGGADSDGDTMSDAVEVVLQSLGATAPVDFTSDTDTDGAPDYFELLALGHPVEADHPALGGAGQADDDDTNGPPSDGISDALEALLVGLGTATPVSPASDNDADGLPDYLEVQIGSGVTDANDPTVSGGDDSNDATGPSGDGISDALEAWLIANGATGPIDATTDTDGDGVPDWIEVFEGSDPFDPNSTPRFGTRPRAENVAISDATVIGREVFGSYTYVDNEGDPEGATTFQWFRNNVAVPGATGTSLIVNPADIGATLRFEVTPVSDFAFPSSTAVGFVSTAGYTVPSLPFPIGSGGPGGFLEADATSPLETWLRADFGIESTVLAGEEIVTAWRDQSGKVRDAIPSADSPEFVPDGGPNGQPTVRFETNALEIPRPVEDDFTLFAVFSTLSTAGNDVSSWWLSPALIGGEFAGGARDFHLGVNFGEPLITADGATLTADGVPVEDGNPHSIEGVRDTLGTLAIYVDSFFAVTAIGGGTNSLDNPQEIQIGASTPTQGFFDGDIHEIVITSSLLSINERIILSNYVGAKYGITVENDRYAFEGTHGGEVAGFGQANFLDLTRSAEGHGIVEISNPSLLSGSDYLFWGTDMPRDFTISTETPGAVNSRWLRTWALDLTDGGGGDGVGTVDVRFRVGGLALPTDAADYVLLYDNDLDFSDATVFTNGATYDAMEDTITFTGLDPALVTYFTLGFELP